MTVGAQRKKKKRKRRGGRPMKRTCQDVLETADELRRLAMTVGLDVHISHFVSRGRKSIHVMLDFFGARILNWWPGTGTTLAFDGQKEKADDIDAVLEIARRTLERHPDASFRAVTS